uniref:Uncharacterized protein n=1 Tax=Arundo donax TaxID=35708 RepID=A0A0A9D8R7_ARUDO
MQHFAVEILSSHCRFQNHVIYDGIDSWTTLQHLCRSIIVGRHG